MSLANIVYPPPTSQGWNEWLFYHQQDHLQIVQQIQRVKNIILPSYVIDPMDDRDFQGWAERHQNFHNDMNGILGLNGVDLQQVDFSDKQARQEWMWLNFSEHRGVHNALGGGF